ncbi:MAG: helix-turn-helix domain-containing protein [Planctomycetes bacterium]|nr:helix-turn-helix domain-containing protein [Planctomycetota bacterium]
MEIGSRIKEFRIKRGMSADQVAEACGVGRSTVFRWEKGESLPTATNLRGLSDLFGVDLDTLTGRQGSINKEVTEIEPRRKKPKESKDKLASAFEVVMELAKDLKDLSVKDVRELLRDRSNVLNITLKRMIRYENLPMPLQGVANADMAEGRTYDADSEEAGRLMAADADDPRLIVVRGDSAENLARNGQVVMVDTSFTNVAVGEPCIVLTRDGHLRLKRKAKDSNGCRSYDSINPVYPAFQVPAREVVAEFPVCGVFLKPRNLDTLETVLEVAPPQRASKPNQKRRAPPKK